MNKFKENFMVKSDLIRTIYKAIPYASNRQIKDIIKEKYNVDVSSTHIIAAIGKHKTRRALSNNTGLLKAATEYLSTFKDDIDHAFYWLHQAKGKV